MRTFAWMTIVTVLAALPSSAAPAAKIAGSFAQHGNAVRVYPTSGATKIVEITERSLGILEVTKYASYDARKTASLAVVPAPPSGGHVNATRQGNVVTITDGAATAQVSLADGTVKLSGKDGKVVLAEKGPAQFAPKLVDGQRFYAIRQEFNPGTTEAFYGLGQHEAREFNYNGEDVDLAQHNMDIAVPFLVSSRNYGVLWDNDGITRFGDPNEYQSITRSLTVTDDKGALGGLTASYFVNGALKLTRREADVNYQYIKDMANWPPSLWNVKAGNMVRGVTVNWNGKLTSEASGVHRFRLYVSSYVKVFVDGKPVIDAWRQNWNPWYRNFDVPMTAGVPVSVRIEWTPNDGYIRLLHQDPLPAAERHELSLSSEVAQAVDYYFVSGKSMDDVVHGYRAITGRAPMLPKWAFGYWQSKDHYQTQDELLGVVKEYRTRDIPLDNIVQDWMYWREDSWGSHQFDPARYPDPAAMVKAVHDAHAHMMISVWPKFYPTTKNYQELADVDGVYLANIQDNAKDWVGPGYLSTYYDPYNAKARDIYWRQIQENLGVLGIDAWWIDNDEPDIRSNMSPEQRARLAGPTAMGPGAEYFNTFPLMHAQAIDEHWNQQHPDTRAFVFSRSGFAGIQRYATANWSGDLTARWSDFADQVPAGLNYAMSGLPYWTFDIGGYVVEDKYADNPTPEALSEWRELYLRWFQYGAFVPIFRAHGQGRPREIYNIAPEGSEIYNGLVWYDQLRYRLMPYIYTLASDVFWHDAVMMHPLAMDFPGDANLKSMGDEYMFGPSFLVAPVTRYEARTWPVYLPAGTRWYDFYTGKAFEGGRKIDADAPLSRMPLFVRAGAVVPVGPAVQYTGEKPDAPITLFVYAGANGHFDLYEDDGTSNGYQRNQFTRIPISYDDKSGAVTIGARQGDFPGAPKTRVFQVRWINGERPDAVRFDAPPDTQVTYSGGAITVPRPAK